MNYKIKLDIFEGPLDLLLYLIKKNDMDIINIPIVEITDQYMRFIDLMKMLDLDTVGDFLVMAATLMQIKSRMLLPPAPSEIEEEEDDPRDELVKRLQEYKRFKEIADILKEKETERNQLFSRQYEEETLKKFKKDAEEVYFEANLFDLINAFSSALKKIPEEIIHEIIKEGYTVEKKIHAILQVLLTQPSIRLNSLFEQSRSKLEVVVTFLAVLELIRLKEIKAVQQRAFSEIEILRNKDNIIPIEK
ncbi:MAG: segregation/condensation protein A [Candidatus Omnitrophica bacterium]|nr:segregation/condensation protein A [Candidatus Omnitrophota bacterium]